MRVHDAFVAEFEDRDRIREARYDDDFDDRPRRRDDPRDSFRAGRDPGERLRPDRGPDERIRGDEPRPARPQRPPDDEE